MRKGDLIRGHNYILGNYRGVAKYVGENMGVMQLTNGTYFRDTGSLMFQKEHEDGSIESFFVETAKDVKESEETAKARAALQRERETAMQAAIGEAVGWLEARGFFVILPNTNYSDTERLVKENRLAVKLNARGVGVDEKLDTDDFYIERVTLGQLREVFALEGFGELEGGDA